MKTNIEVKADGELFINQEKKQVDDLTQELLEKILDDSLSDEVEFCIEGDTPLAKFFNTIKSGTEEGSELRTLKKKNDATQQARAEREEVSDTQVEPKRSSC